MDPVFHTGLQVGKYAVQNEFICLILTFAHIHLINENRHPYPYNAGAHTELV